MARGRRAWLHGSERGGAGRLPPGSERADGAAACVRDSRRHTPSPSSSSDRSGRSVDPTLANQFKHRLKRSERATVSPSRRQGWVFTFFQTELNMN